MQRPTWQRVTTFVQHQPSVMSAPNKPTPTHDLDRCKIDVDRKKIRRTTRHLPRTNLLAPKYTCQVFWLAKKGREREREREMNADRISN